LARTLDECDDFTNIFTATLPSSERVFWNAATRPQVNNGLGMSTKGALDELIRLESFFTLLDESAAVYQAWRGLVLSHGVSGAPVHDARLVAAMTVHNVPRIETTATTR
jgi:hypothetical protein